MQIKITTGLTEIIKENGREIVQQWLEEQFQCDKNYDIQRFLVQSAIRFEIARLARTYVILDEHSRLLAYFTLSFKSVRLNTSKSQLKKLTGGLTNSNQINAYLIGQIGKNSSIADNPIHLNEILEEIYPIVEQGQAAFGGRSLILECDNNPRLIAHYEKHGFKLVETDDETDLKTMFIIPEFNQ